MYANIHDMHINVWLRYVNESVRCGNAVLEFRLSRDNWADMLKPVGMNIFLDHSPKVMGEHLVPKVSRMVKSVEKDTLPAMSSLGCESACQN